MQRRLSPAMATVALTAQRLTDLSRRIRRASACSHTRVDIATDLRSPGAADPAFRGQSTQLRMQATVETLHRHHLLRGQPAALCVQGAQAAELVAAEPQAPVSPLVLAGVWWTTRRIHRRFFGHGPAA